MIRVVYKEITKKGEAPNNTEYIYQSTNTIKYLNNVRRTKKFLIVERSGHKVQSKFTNAPSG